LEGVFASHKVVGRRLRFIPPDGSLVEVTNRTIQGRFLLRPSRELNELLIGILGRAQRLYRVKLHACTVLSNHYHMLISVTSAAQMAQFMAYFQGNLAKEAGRLHKWRGPFWHRRYQHILVSDEDAAQIGRLRYTLANGCKENLVASPLDWPGVNSTRALLESEQLEGYWIDRTREQHAVLKAKKDRSLFRQPETVSFSPLPCWMHLQPSVLQQRIRELVTEIEAEALRRHHAEGTQPLGKRNVLRLDPHGLPLHSKWSPAPMFHCASKQARYAFREAYDLFCATFRQAADRLRAGKLPTAFPAGAFPPPMPLQLPIQAPG
jgi:REP element-mobilizing transposase RayT